MAVALLLPASAAAAAACPAPGGVSIPGGAPAEGDFVISGRGWGHGVGMSQYGAHGASQLGCTAPQILRAYYKGTSIGTGASTTPIRVSVYTAATTLRVVADTGALPWQACGARSCVSLGITQPQGSLWYARTASDGAPSLDNGTKTVWKGSVGTRLRVLATTPGGAARIVKLPFSGRRYKWGWVEVAPRRRSDGVFRSFVTVGVPSVELYLRGLGEMPSSWGPAALQAQSIVGRSYALHRRDVIGLRSSCVCHVYDSVSDQAYLGYAKESEGTDGYFGKRWVAAVTATAGKVLRDGAGKLAVGYYSSSHGGASESSRFVWGGSVDYLQPTDDSRWEMASGNPGRTWSVGVSAETLGRAFGVGVARGVRTPDPKGLRGRIGRTDLDYGGVTITGSTGTRRVSGADFRVTINRVFGREVMRSTLFTVAAAGAATPAPQPATPAGSVCPPADDYTFDSASRRIGGTTPAAVAAGASRAHWRSAKTVVITGPTAATIQVVAPALAARKAAPILLTTPDTLPAATRRELERLAPETIYILGGASVVSAPVAAALDALPNARVLRIAGSTRYTTAARIARAAGPSATGDVVLTVGSHSSADRVWHQGSSAGALAATPDRIPTLLTSRGSVPQVTIDALKALRARRVLLLGGGGTVGSSVGSQLRALGYDVSRIGSDNRFFTAAAVARVALARQPKPARAILASSARPAEPAVMAAVAARVRGVSALGARCDLDDTPAVRDFLRASRARVSSVTVVGPRASIDDLVRYQAGNAVRG